MRLADAVLGLPCSQIYTQHLGQNGGSPPIGVRNRAGRQAAINDKRLAGYEARFVASQVDGRIGNVGRAPPNRQRLGKSPQFFELRLGSFGGVLIQTEGAPEHRCRDHARIDAVNADFVGR